MSKPPNPTTLEARRQAEALQRVTGEWYCASGGNYTKAEQARWRGRRICVPCRDRLVALTKKQRAR
jgi:hypothetical protein